MNYGIAVGAVATAASAVIATADVIFRNVNTNRNVSIEISNDSNTYDLTNPKTHMISGYCDLPPQPTVAKNKQEKCSFSKNTYSLCGAVGVLTYQILSDESTGVGDLAIMFSAPYDYGFYQNWFAVGIFEAGTSCDYNLFKKMYYDDDGPFTRDKGSGSVITHSVDGVLVKGTMSAFGKTIIKVELWDQGLAAFTKTETEAN